MLGVIERGIEQFVLVLCGGLRRCIASIFNGTSQRASRGRTSLLGRSSSDDRRHGGRRLEAENGARTALDSHFLFLLALLLAPAISFGHDTCACPVSNRRRGVCSLSNRPQVRIFGEAPPQPDCSHDIPHSPENLGSFRVLLELNPCPLALEPCERRIALREQRLLQLSAEAFRKSSICGDSLG